MRVPRLLQSKVLYTGVLLLTALAFLAKFRWEQEEIKIALTPYVKGRVSFKVNRPDNYLQFYIEDLVQLQISPDVKELLIVRHTPSDDLLRLPIEEAQLEPNRTVMLVTHRQGNLYRIFIHPESFILTVVSNAKNVLAVETGVKLSDAQVRLFKEDPLYQEGRSKL
jgi:hypothetical protein